MTSNKPATDTKLQDFEFEQMNLQVGGRIQFITHRTIKPIQHFSTLIGYVKDEYLIVKIPQENGAAIVLNEGDKLTIRVFSGVIQGTSLRTAMRVKVEIPAQLNYRDVPAVPVFIVNLSVSGALIESPCMLTPDDDGVALSFTLLVPPNKHQMRIHARARIQNVSVGKPSNGHAAQVDEIHTYGVQFIDLEPTHYTMLQNLTYEALIADRQKIV